MPLFGKSQKSPAEVVKALKEAVNSLERGDKKAEKAQEDVSKNLVLIKNMLYGTSDTEPQTDIIVAQLAQELYNSSLLLLLIQNLNRIDFEDTSDSKTSSCLRSQPQATTRFDKLADYNTMDGVRVAIASLGLGHSQALASECPSLTIQWALCAFLELLCPALPGLVRVPRCVPGVTRMEL